jgi:hypothetical protein
MKQFIRAVAVATALSVGIVGSHCAKAEYCWMVGCGGLIGYTYLPVRDTYPGDVVMSCSPFGSKSLPDVNSEVAIEAGMTFVYSVRQIENDIKNFPRMSTQSTMAECEGRPAPTGMELRQGERVKILGYRTFSADPQWVNDLPFALVMVLQ